MKKFLSFGFFSSCFFVGALFAQVPSSDPALALKKISEKVLTKITAEQKKGTKNLRERVGAIIKENIMPNVDTIYASKMVIERVDWNNASEKDRQRFAAAFSNLIAQVYTAAFMGYKGEKVHFQLKNRKKSDYESGMTMVHSTIVGKEGPTSLNYDLHFAGNEWLIYDFNIGGVSILSNFRGQFSALLNLISKKNKDSQDSQNSKVLILAKEIEKKNG